MICFRCQSAQHTKCEGYCSCPHEHHKGAINSRVTDKPMTVKDFKVCPMCGTEVQQQKPELLYKLKNTHASDEPTNAAELAIALMVIEECAQIAEGEILLPLQAFDGTLQSHGAWVARTIAAAIRALDTSALFEGVNWKVGRHD